jgi:predicted  nucleic acid-binding Zn-ribbon protein
MTMEIKPEELSDVVRPRPIGIALEGADTPGQVQALRNVNAVLQRELDATRSELAKEEDRQSDTEHLARAVAQLTVEVEGLARHASLLGNAVASLMDAKAQFSEEDIALIKMHVRHPGALEAARLRETIRCALLAITDGAFEAAKSILGGADAKG